LVGAQPLSKDHLRYNKEQVQQYRTFANKEASKASILLAIMTVTLTESVQCVFQNILASEERHDLEKVEQMLSALCARYRRMIILSRVSLKRERERWQV